MPFPLTEEQRRIVDDRGGELLVSAAAGSGKTRVLVERLLDRVTKDGLDIDRFLVITYTRAAAAELRTRIAQELSARLAQEPRNLHLRRQATLVYEARISTIHAFCSALLRESGHLVNLDPDFRLCDEGEAQVLMIRTLEELLDRRYEEMEEDSGFSQLVDTMSAGRDDSQLARIVLDIYSRIQSHPDPERWLREQAEAWDLGEVQDVAQTEWGRPLLQDVQERCRWCREQLQEALGLADRDELLAQNYGPGLQEGIRSLDGVLAQDTWDGVYHRLPIGFPRPGMKKKRTKAQTPEEQERSAADGARVRGIRERCMKLLKKLPEDMEADSRTLLLDMDLCAPAVVALMALVTDFQRAYGEAKRKKNLMDFSDLEHLSLKVLLDEDGNPTDLADSWSARFAEVLVDEYQDTNQVQNAIFGAISGGGSRLFQVGDVKQSIYRFRLADPTIFLDKYHRYAPGEEAEDGAPRRRILSCNFRSRREVLEGCNDLFRAVMSEAVGEIGYTEDQALVPGARFPEGTDYALEADLIDLSFLTRKNGEEEEDEEEKENRDELEARFAARRIRELLDSGLLIGSGAKRHPVRPSDIMILLRSPGRVQRFYRRALEEQGIPWAAEGGGSIFETTEVNVALAILQIVDNPHQDVPLIAAMRSPVFSFSADRLARLRAGERDGDFYGALVRAAEEENGEDCRAFLAQLEEMRFGAGDCTCRQLIWSIYEKTNILGIFGAMDAKDGEAGRQKGQERQENLLALYALAGQMEDAGCRTLFQFLMRLDRLRAAGREIVTPSAPKETGGVSILSIHRSKGLEKPVVLVCGLMKQFNTEDMRQPVLFHPKMGIGPMGLDLERMVQYNTLARKAVGNRLRQEMLSEEMRLLYVAMTRAQEKLILTLAVTRPKQLQELGSSTAFPVPPQVLAMQSSMGAWVLLHLLTRPEAEGVRRAFDVCDIPLEQKLGPAWDVRLYDGIPLRYPVQPPEEGRFADLTRDEREDAEVLARKLSWTYDHQSATEIPSKLTATQLKGRILDMEAAEEAVPAGTEPEPERKTPLMRPYFIAGTRGLTYAQRGIALHQAMQYIPMEGDHSEAGIRAVLQKLEEGKFLTHLQVEAIRPSALTAFFLSPLGKEMCTAPLCRREFKFSLLVPAGTYFDGVEEEEEVLLQGVVDAWFGDQKGITVLDFKSDRIHSGEESARAERYRFQLNTYSRALEQILSIPVKRRILWFFATGTAVEL